MRAALLAAWAAAAVHAGFPAAPLFKQCDPHWANTPMGTKGNGEDSTICGEGCAMSSLSMAMNAFGVQVPIGDGMQLADPLTFNAWLETHNGYTCAAGDCNNLVLDAVSRLNSSFTLVGEIPPPPIAAVEAGLAAGQTVYLAHVTPPECSGPCHFVLLTGVVTPGSGNFIVNDPYYNVTSYAMSDIHDFIVYNVTTATSASSGEGQAPLAPWAKQVQAQLAAGVHAGAVKASHAAPVAAPAPALRGSSRSSAKATSSSAASRFARVAVQPVVPISYPLYKQCDDAWASDRIGNETTVTICDVGCLMSSISMALAHNNITVPDLGGSAHWSTANPQSLNTWLQLNNGYVDGDDFDEDDLPALDPSHVQWSDAWGMHTKNDVAIPTIQSLLTVGQPVIANVMHGGHFVLVVGWDAANTDTLLVNDPGFDTQSYSYSQDVVGWRLFNMTARAAPGRA